VHKVLSEGGSVQVSDWLLDLWYSKGLFTSPQSLVQLWDSHNLIK
jgi:hypothetical protein